VFESWLRANLPWGPIAFDWISLNREKILVFALIAILGATGLLLNRRKHMARPARSLVWLFLLFTLLSAAARSFGAFDQPRWLPNLGASTEVLVDCVILVTAIVIWPVVIRIARQPSPGQLREEIDRQLQTLEELRSVRGELERQVAARTSQLQETTERFEIVLRQSPISVFSQDKDLRYTWIRNPPPAFPEMAVGRTDDELLPPEAARQMREVKQRVVASGVSRRTELVLTADGERHWYDLTVEPLRAVDGNIIGTTSAAIDITHRKQGEQLMEMLLREVTHRSKNLLAVIQTIVRHTSPRTASGRSYAARLGARLQALSATHDLLVENNWRGVSLRHLIRAHLGSHADHHDAPVKLDGDDIMLGPNAADSIGLVIHELVDNAARFGALATPGGSVTVRWWLCGSGDGGRVTLDWLEAGGLPVSPPNETGFGRLLVEKGIGLSLSGDVKLEFPANGVHCEISLPLYHVVQIPNSNGAASSQSGVRSL
jgi:two-component sensor histidine kinase